MNLYGCSNCAHEWQSTAPPHEGDTCSWCGSVGYFLQTEEYWDKMKVILEEMLEKMKNKS